MARQRSASRRPRPSRKTSRRDELVTALHEAGRAQSAATVMFHAALAAKLDLSAIEEKTLDILGTQGPLTASQIASSTGLTRASVTALIDRLEKKGFARRVANPADGRSVLVEAVGTRVAMIGPLFDEWARSLEELFETYTNAELEVILRFVRAATDRQRKSTAKLGTKR